MQLPPNRAERRAAARLAMKAAMQSQQPQPAAMTAAAGAAPAPNVSFAEQSEPRPISDAQLAANRANAQKSTGPTSEAGKAKTRLNAVKTGLTGQTVLLPTDDAVAYQAHIDRHFKRYSPEGEQEQTLVQFLADTEWRLLRIAPLEAGVYALGRIENPDLFPEETDPAAREALIRTKLFLLYRRELNNIALQERRLRNQQASDLEKLEALQKERKEKDKALDKIQPGMRQAVNSLLKHRGSRFRLTPRELGLDFSMQEINACVEAFEASQTAGQPEPDYKTVILQFRNSQNAGAPSPAFKKEAEAA